MFITFEGGEGSGKSTQCKLLFDYLQNIGIATVLTREPGGTKSAEEIRKLLVVGNVEKWQPISEALLFMASRAEHWHHVINPALLTGHVVICDRFQDSTNVYQGMTENVSVDMLQTVYHNITGGVLPNRTYILLVDAEIGLKRSLSRSSNNETRFESIGLEFHKKINEYYFKLAQTSDRFMIIDAENSIENIHEKIVNDVKKLILV